MNNVEKIIILGESIEVTYIEHFRVSQGLFKVFCPVPY